jgi:hypothetical protein
VDKLCSVKMPLGWLCQPWHGRGVYAISTVSGSGGAVTVDLDRREYRPGMTIFGGPLNTKRRYAGRGWKQAIVNDAMEWLRKEVTSGR